MSRQNVDVCDAGNPLGREWEYGQKKAVADGDREHRQQQRQLRAHTQRPQIGVFAQCRRLLGFG
jgi:hypothetical protein